MLTKNTKFSFVVSLILMAFGETISLRLPRETSSNVFRNVLCLEIFITNLLNFSAQNRFEDVLDISRSELSRILGRKQIRTHRKLVSTSEAAQWEPRKSGQSK